MESKFDLLVSNELLSEVKVNGIRHCNIKTIDKLVTYKTIYQLQNNSFGFESKSYKVGTLQIN